MNGNLIMRLPTTNPQIKGLTAQLDPSNLITSKHANLHQSKHIRSNQTRCNPSRPKRRHPSQYNKHPSNQAESVGTEGGLTGQGSDFSGVVFALARKEFPNCLDSAFLVLRILSMDTVCKL